MQVTAEGILDAHLSVLTDPLPKYIQSQEPAQDAAAAEWETWAGRVAQYRKDEADRVARIGLALDGHGGLVCAERQGVWIRATPDGTGHFWFLTALTGQVGDQFCRVVLRKTLQHGQPGSKNPLRSLAEQIGVFQRNAIRTFELLPLLDATPGLVIDQAGGACPFQAEGSLHGMAFYFRYRHAHASLELAADGPVPSDQPLFQADVSYGYDDQGHLSTAEFMTLMATLIPALQKAPILWEFKGARTVVEEVAANAVRPPDPVGAETSIKSWGMTAQDAWERLHAPREAHMTLDDWLAHVGQYGLSAETITVDSRVFPDPLPSFTVGPSVPPLEIT